MMMNSDGVVLSRTHMQQLLGGERPPLVRYTRYTKTQTSTSMGRDGWTSLIYHHSWMLCATGGDRNAVNHLAGP